MSKRFLMFALILFLSLGNVFLAFSQEKPVPGGLYNLSDYGVIY